ncbi:unnamed protein product [Rhodiola kirilowii]
MYEYVEKFIALKKSCCNLGLPEKLLVEYMLDGLRKLDRKLLDASAGGNLMDLSPARVRRKIMAVAESERFQDESTKEEEYTRTRNVSRVEPPSSTMAAEIKELKELMQHVIRRQPVQTKPCEFCAATDHKTDECPTLVADDQADVNAVGDYQSYRNRPGVVQQYGAATTNQGVNGQPWKSNNQQHQYQQNGPSQYQHRGPITNQPGPSNQSSNKSLEDMMKELAASNQQLNATMNQHMATTNGAIADLKKQMSQIATTVSRLEDNAGRLPSQTIQNPKGNVSAVTLRIGRRASGQAEDGNPQESEDEATELGTFGLTAKPGPHPREF